MKAAFHTLGCKVNSYETQAIKEQFFALGFEEAAFSEAADVYVVNTCSVTQVAERKSRQMLHRARKLAPHAVIAAAGCYAQEDAQNLIKDEAVDIVVGNNEKSTLALLVLKKLESSSEGTEGSRENPASSVVHTSKEADCLTNTYSKTEQCEGKTAYFYPSVEEYLQKNTEGNLSAPEPQSTDETYDGKKIQVADLMHCLEYEEQKISSAGEHVRAYIKIQDGCNRFCSYCIIPYLRGRSRSRRGEDIITEINALAQNGYKEIIITGIDISDFKMEGFETPAESLLFIIEEISKIPGIERIRLGSLECSVLTERFLEGVSRIGAFCAQFHLSLQSGSDAVLRRMNRRYTTDEYFEKTQLIRKYFPNGAVTTDIIVGFPLESEEEFKESCEFARKVNFSRVHVFKYSKRKGTRAARMEGQIDGSVKARRSQELIALASTLQHSYEEGFTGKSVEVLFEEKTEDGLQIGFTPEYVKVAVKSSESLVNKIVSVVPEKFISTKDGEILLARPVVMS